MQNSNSIQGVNDLSTSSTTHLETDLRLTYYQVAVLSTLFDQEDGNKVAELARQWGCEQAYLQSVWCRMHGCHLSSAEDAVAPIICTT